jgi:hypothetical protein
MTTLSFDCYFGFHFDTVRAVSTSVRRSSRATKMLREDGKLSATAQCPLRME